MTVKTGAAVEWRFAGPEPHSVTFLPPGQTPPSPEIPEGEALFAPSTPPATTYDGKSLVNSGLAAPRPGPGAALRAHVPHRR